MSNSGYSTIDNQGERRLANMVFSIIQGHSEIEFHYENIVRENGRVLAFSFDAEKAMKSFGKYELVSIITPYLIEMMLKYQTIRERIIIINNIPCFEHEHNLSFIFERLSEGFRMELDLYYRMIIKQNKKYSEDNDYYKIGNIEDIIREISNAFVENRYGFFREISRQGSVSPKQELRFRPTQPIALMKSLYQVTQLYAKRGINLQGITIEDDNTVRFPL